MLNAISKAKAAKAAADRQMYAIAAAMEVSKGRAMKKGLAAIAAFLMFLPAPAYASGLDDVGDRIVGILSQAAGILIKITAVVAVLALIALFLSGIVCNEPMQRQKVRNGCIAVLGFMLAATLSVSLINFVAGGAIVASPSNFIS